MSLKQIFPLIRIHISEIYDVETQLSTNESLKCQAKIFDTELIPIMLFPFAFAFLIVGAFIVPRKSAGLSFCFGRPGVMVPLNYLNMRQNVLLNIVVYCAYANVLFGLFTDGIAGTNKAIKFLNEWASWLHLMVKMVMMLIMGCSCYPLFAVFTQRHIVITVMGTMYTLTYAGLCLYNNVYTFICYESMPEYTITFFLQSLPSVVSLFILSVLFVIQSTIIIRETLSGHTSPGNNDELEDGLAELTIELTTKKMQHRSRAQRYMALFFERKKWDTDIKLSMAQKIKLHSQKLRYRKIAGFRYSPQFLASMAFTVVIIYGLSLYVFILLHSVYSLTHSIFQSVYVTKITDYAPFDEALAILLNFTLESISDSKNHQMYETALAAIILYYIRIILICICVGVFFCVVYTLTTVAHIVINYRQKMVDLSRGNFDNMRDISKKSSPGEITFGFIVYLGYQVGYLAVSFLMYCMVLSLLMFFISVILVIPLYFGFWNNVLIRISPSIVLTYIIRKAQALIAKYAFTPEYGKFAGVTNRRWLFVFMHFLFFYNIVIGMFSLMLRFIKGSFFGLFFVGRLDYPLFPRFIEHLDRSNGYFLSYLYMENLHSNPILLAFVEQFSKDSQIYALDRFGNPLPMTFSGATRDCPEKDEERKSEGIAETLLTGAKNLNYKQDLRRTRAVIRWKLAYTLIWNPVIASQRKTALKICRDRLSKFSENTNKRLRIV